MNERLYLSPPHLSGTEIDYVKEAFDSNWVAPLGPMVDRFEQEVCAYTGARHAVALSSGTAAIHLSLLRLGVKPGDEVLCSSFTFAGSVFPIYYTGATPVFIDSEESSWNIDPGLLEEAIKDRIKRGKTPKAAIIVHLYGQSADMDTIMNVCSRYGIPVIEDAAESIGATYKGIHTGTIAPFGVLSFNGNKIITSSGGGMLLCHEKEDAEHAKYLSTQAREKFPHYEHITIGYNYRMSNIVAAIGRGQLTVLSSRVNRRREIFDYYRDKLGKLPGIGFMPEATWGSSNRWLSCMLVDPQKTGTTSEAIRLALEHENIESRPLWKPMHQQPVFRECPAYLNGCSDRLFADGLCLPSGTAMTEGDLVRVVSIVRGLCRF